MEEVEDSIGNRSPSDLSPRESLPFVEVICTASGKTRRFSNGTEAGFALHLMTKKLEKEGIFGIPLASHIEAVKEGEEPVSFGPNSLLVNYGLGWKLQTVNDIEGVVKGNHAGSQRAYNKKMALSNSKGKEKVVENHGFDPNFQPETFTVPSTGYHIEISDDDDGGAQPHTETQEGVQNQGNVGEERKGRALKSDMFTKHFTKVTLPSGEVRAKCNYCTNSYACKKRMGYGSLKQHMENHHAVEYGLDRKQMQITGYVSSTTGCR